MDVKNRYEYLLKRMNCGVQQQVAAVVPPAIQQQQVGAGVEATGVVEAPEDVEDEDVGMEEERGEWWDDETQ
jgi:hypothetical protein